MDPLTIGLLVSGLASLGGSIIGAATDDEKTAAPAPSPGYVAQAPATRVPDQAAVKTEAQAGIYDELKAKQDLKTLKEEDELAAAPAV